AQGTEAATDDGRQKLFLSVLLVCLTGSLASPSLPPSPSPSAATTTHPHALRALKLPIGRRHPAVLRRGQLPNKELRAAHASALARSDAPWRWQRRDRGPWPSDPSRGTLR